MADKFAGYDDAQVTLGDGCLNIESAMFGVEKVAGSRSFVRDPRLSQLVRGQGSSQPEKTFDTKNDKWCFACGHTRPKSYFTAKKGTWDGLDPRCKECENERQRQRYQVSVNRDVRPYGKHNKAAV